MYTLLRVGKNYDKSASFSIADWSDSTIDTLSAAELQQCLKLGMKIEGVKVKDGKMKIISAVPVASGSDIITVLADSCKLGTTVSMLTSYSYVDSRNTLSISFKVGNEPFYGDLEPRNMEITTPVEVHTSVLYYDRQKKEKVKGHVIMDYIRTSDMKYLETKNKNPLFKLTLCGMDKHFYGEDREEYFFKEYILEYRNSTKKFYYVGGTNWKKQDDSDYIVPDDSGQNLILNVSKKVVFRCM